jgi:hypothetical protein
MRGTPRTARAKGAPGAEPDGCGAALEELSRLPDVSRLTGAAGQVLLYAGHFPPGLFVLLGGALRLEDPAGRSRGNGRAADPAGVEPGGAPALVPPLDELELPSTKDVIVSADCELLAVPRSLALASPSVRRLLARCGARPVSLQNGRKTTERS